LIRNKTSEENPNRARGKSVNGKQDPDWHGYLDRKPDRKGVATAFIVANGRVRPH